MVILAAGFLNIVYLVCFLLGLCYAIFAAIFSGLGGGGEADVGHDIGVDVDAGGEIDLGGGHDIVSGMDVDAADVGHAPGGMDHGPGISPFSPPIVAMTLVTFGGTGIIFTKLVGWEALSLLPSSVSGIVMGLVTFAFFYTMAKKIQGSSSPSLGETIGIEAEATTPIPPDGVGEIAYVARGSRFTARAKSMTGDTLSSHTTVRIVKWVGHTAQVKPVE
ncbi:MAG: NfeD family protein [Planctomycetes bacterium]|nr:NfeD family protein [Planctomycetota bacterium]